MARILVIEDEQDLGTLLEYNLKADGHEAEVVRTGAAGIGRLSGFKPDLVLLDLMLPDIAGSEVARLIREGESRRVPIIMVTARSEETDRVRGLELGADDYVTKPFNPRELVARVRAVLRRADNAGGGADAPQDTIIELDELRIEVGGREVFVDGERVALTPKEFDLLVTLIENRGIVLTREQLLEQVWGFTFLGDSRTIDVHVRQLRRKLEDACPIQTVWGTGYKVPAKR